MPEFHCQAQHCYHKGTVFRWRWACCRCSPATAGCVPRQRDPEGSGEREEKTHGFIGCNAGTPHYPIYTSIDRKIAEALRSGAAIPDSDDLADLLRIVGALDDKLRRAPVERKPSVIVLP